VRKTPTKNENGVGFFKTSLDARWLDTHGSGWLLGHFVQSGSNAELQKPKANWLRPRMRNLLRLLVYTTAWNWEQGAAKPDPPEAHGAYNSLAVPLIYDYSHGLDLFLKTKLQCIDIFMNENGNYHSFVKDDEN
jgi:hypothetical protein